MARRPSHGEVPAIGCGRFGRVSRDADEELSCGRRVQRSTFPVRAAHATGRRRLAIHHRTESKSMSYLDVAPLITALRNTPEEFELSSGWLCHVRSWHSFRVGPEDRVEIRAACNCVLLAVRPEQEREFAGCFREWQAAYWRPLQINREFAAHFRPRASWRRTLLRLTVRLTSWLVDEGPETRSAATKAA